jgi:hypothetical protein
MKSYNTLIWKVIVVYWSDGSKSAINNPARNPVGKRSG